MEVAIEELRRTMRQELLPHRTQLAPQTYLEEYESVSFGGDSVADLFHENSKYVPGVMGKPRRSVAAFESAAMAFTQATVRPDYAGQDLIELPREPVEVDLQTVLKARRSATQFDEAPVSRRVLGTILDAACGVTASVDIDHEEFETPRSKPVRAYPSAGALYPIETYLLVLRATDLPTGRYYYVPERHALRELELDGGLSERVDRAFPGAGGGDPSGASVLFILAASTWRTLAKYGPRGYRYLLQESGHLVQNLLLLCVATGLDALPVGGYYDDVVNDLLGIDGVNETTVYAVAAAPNEAKGGGLE